MHRLLLLAGLTGLSAGWTGRTDGEPVSVANGERLPITEEPGARQPAGAFRPKLVRLKSGTFAGLGTLETNLRAARASALEMERVHVLLQFAQIPDGVAQARLAERGVALVAYVPDAAYFASLPPEADAAWLATHGVRWLGRIQPADKLSDTLRSGQPGVWAREADGQIRVRVRIFSDARFDEAVAAVAGQGVRLITESARTGVIEAAGELEAVRHLAALDGVRWIEEAPPPAEVFNDGLRANLQVPVVAEPPYGLSGTNVVVGIWDAGWVDLRHPDFGGRVSVGESAGPIPNHFHATHVAGTLAGDGTASQRKGGQPLQWRGVAPGVRLISYDVDKGDLIDEHRDAQERFGAVLSQNSWGRTVGAFFGNCHLLGDYTGDARDYDRVATGLFGAPCQVVFAVGNARGRRDTSGCPSPSGYRTVGIPTTAKNAITVGAIHSDDNSATVFSGWGPTDDGRLKPEVVAPGDEVGGDGGITSTQPDSNYGTLVGTSMAAPAVSGVAALLIGDYRNRFNGQTPLPATVKGLLIHTAADLDDETDWHNPGPDFASGYGRVQARGAVDQLRAGGFVIGQVGQDQRATYWLDVPAATSQVKITLVWDDLAAVENAARTLVNDLDLVVTDPDNVRHFPWTLDPANPAAPAVRSAEDHANNVEQVAVDAGVVPGRWTVSVVGTATPTGTPQKFALLFTPARNAQVPLLVLEEVQFNDASEGNGNGFVDRGEEIAETIVLRNSDGPATGNLLARLSTTSPWVSLLTPEVPYSNIAPGEAATSPVPVRYLVSKNAPCGHAFVLEQVIPLGEYYVTNLLPHVVGRVEVTNTVRRVFAATGLPLPIPDTSVVRSTLRVEEAGVVHSVGIRLRLDHAYTEDLELKLRHPDGTEVLLVPALQHAGQDFGRGECGPEVEWTGFADDAAAGLGDSVAPFVGRFRPEQPLAVLANRGLAGDWQLIVADTSLEDEGTLRCWELEVEYAVYGYLCELVNRPPVASDQPAVVYVNRSDLLTLEAYDPDGDAMTARIVSPPAHGTLSELDSPPGHVRYAPQPDYLGPDRFVFLVEDGYAQSAPATVSIDVRPATADLAVSQALAVDPPWQDQPFSLLVTVTNRGPSRATGVRLTVRWSGDLELVAHQTSQGTAEPTERGISAEFGLVEESGSARLSLEVRAPDPTWVSSLATVVSGVIESAPDDNTASLTFPVVGTADLALGAVAIPDPMPVGQPFTFRLSVTNTGPYLASNVTLRSELPPAISVVGALPSQGSWTQVNGVLTGRMGSLSVGASAQVELTLLPALSGSLPIAIEARSDLHDPRPANNTGVFAADVRRLTDLALAWTPPAQPLAIGQTFTNVLIVNNRGPADASQISVRVDLAQSAAFVRALPDQGVATQAAGVVTWTVEGVVAGGEARLPLVLRATSVGWMITVATVAAREFDPLPADNRLEQALDVRREADLTTALTLPPPPYVIGQQLAYQLSVTNIGPNLATIVVLEHDVPPGATFLEASATQGTVSRSGARLTATLGDLAFGAAATVSIRVALETAGETVLLAQAHAYEADLRPANNRIERPMLLEEPADLALVKRAEPAVTLFSREALYTLVVTNQGPHAAGGVRATDLLPPGLIVLGTEASHGRVNPVEGGFVFEFGALPVGQTATGWVRVLATQDGRITNTAVVTAEQPDLEPSNNVAEAPLETLPAVDLAVLDWRAVSPVVVNREAQFELTLTNRGPYLASHVQVSYDLGDNTEVVSATGPAGACVTQGTSVTCEIGELAPGISTVLALVLRPRSAEPLEHRVTLTATEGELEPMDNVVEVIVPVGRDADLALDCFSETANTSHGGAFRWTLSVTNRGPFAAQDVRLETTWLAEEVTLLAVEPTQGGWESVPGGVVARLGTVAVNGTARVVVTVRAEQAGLMALQASVSSLEADFEADDNTCATEVNVLATANLAVRKEVAPEPGAFGFPLRCLITLTNQGPDTATGIVVLEQLLGGLDLVEAAPSDGLWRLDPEGLRWELDRLGPGGAATLEVTLTPTQAGWVTNRCTVSSQQPDPAPADNVVERITAIRFPADLALSVSGPAPPVVLGQPAEYRLTLQNLGPYPASVIRLTHTLANALRLDLTQASEGTVFGVGGELSWHLLELAPDASAVLTVRVTPMAEGQFVERATVSAFEADLVPENNEIPVPITVFGQAELTLRQRGFPERVLAGQPVTFDLTVSNAGPRSATGVVLTNWLTSELALLHVEASQGTLVTHEDRIEIRLGAVSARAEVGAQVRFATRAAGRLINLAGVGAEQADLNTADNLAATAVEADPAADLTVVKALVNPIALLDEPLHYRLTVTNAGPNAATRVRLTDRFPPSLELLEVLPQSEPHQVEGHELVYERSQLNPGESAELTLVFRAVTPGPVTNLAAVAAFDPDPWPDDNETATLTDVLLGADLELLATGPVEAPFVGQPSAYTLTVMNHGPYAASDVGLRVELPSAARVASVELDQGTWDRQGNTLLATFGDLAVGGEAALRLTLIPEEPGLLVLAATASTTAGDWDPSNNAVQVSRETGTGADLALEIFPDFLETIFERDLSYTLLVSNLGPTAAAEVVVTNLLPANAALLSIEDNGGTWEASGGVVTGRVGTLPAGAHAWSVLTLRPIELGALSAPARVMSPTADPRLGNNAMTFTGALYLKADLQVTHEPLPPQLMLSNAVNVSLLITNRGTIPAPRTGLLVALSLNVELMGAVLLPEIGTVSLAPPGVVCSFGELAPGEGARVIIRLRPTHAGRFVSQATLFSPAADPDDPGIGSRLERDILRAPSLVATRDGSRLVLSWPAIADNFALESKELATDPEWSPVLNPREIEGDQILVNLKLSGTQRLFRLRRAEEEVRAP